MATKSISQLDTQATANETDLFEVAIVDANSASGYASKKESAAAIADAIVGEYQYPLRITGTTAKTIAGAINELKNLVDLLPQFAIEVVQTLPVSDISETTIYLVPASDPEQGNYYEEYIYVNNAWELVGTTAVDLSGYYTSAQVDTLLAAKANTSSLATVATSGAYSDLSGKPTIDTALDDTSTNAVENRAVASEINSIKSDITVDGSASGDIATFVDGSANPLKELKISIEATQSGSGDPSPTNVRPISGWTGANIYNLHLPNGYHACDYVELTNDRVELSVLDSYARDDLIIGVCFKVISTIQYGSIYVSYVGESYNATRAISRNVNANGFYINNNTRASSPYSPSATIDAKNNFVYFQSYHNKFVYQNTNYNFIPSSGDTNTNNKMYIGHSESQIQYKSFWIKTTSGTYITCLVPCINPNGVSGFYDIVNNNFVTTSDPTKANAVGNFNVSNILEFPPKATIDWQSTAGTVYGGMLDVLNGTFTVTHILETYDGTEDWADGQNNAVYVTNSVSTDPDSVLEANFLKGLAKGSSGSMTAWTVRLNANMTNLLVRPNTEVIADAAAWKTYLASNNLQVLYKLATPIEYNLTPTEIRSLLGLNNVWADCGAITELKYTRDLNLCINDIIARIEALEGASSSRSLSLSANLTKSIVSDSDTAEGKTEEETEEETKEEAQNER